MRVHIGPCVAGLLLPLAYLEGLDLEGPSQTVRHPGAVEPVVSSTSAPTIDAAVRGVGADENWWGAVSSQIAREEYHATVTSEGLQAPNRAHNLRTYFHEWAIEVVPRASGGEARWRLTWQTARWGRAGEMQAVKATGMPPAANGSRVTYERGALAEWYDNRPEGLEQGFTVRERPAGNGPVRIEGGFGGRLRAEMRPEDDAVDLLDEAGARVLRYGELHVEDVRGRELPSRLELSGMDVTLVVDDAGAEYPLTVDPLLTSPSWIAESNQANADFGWSTGTSGDVNGDGYSDIIVGARYYDNGQTDEGRAFVYHGSPTGLAVSPTWTAESNQASAYFGAAVGTAGDVNGDGYSDVIVGASWYDNPQTDEGRAFVYHGSSTGLAVSPTWTAESNQASADFGFAVGTAGDVNGDGYSDVIIGATWYDNGQSDEGRAFLYHGSSSGLADSPAWSVEGNQSDAYFGWSVATAGDVNGDGYSDVIVGTPQYDVLQTDEGRAFVYHGSSSGLASSAAWTAWGDQVGAWFGFPVRTAGDVNGDGYSDVVVGASNYDNGQTDEGRAFVYHGSSSGLGSAPAWTVESDQDGARFGISVNSAGDMNGDGYSDVIVGAINYDHGQTDEGRAYVYHGASSGLAVSPAWTAESDQDAAHFGRSVGTAGDVNGDGYSDVIVGAHAYDNGETDEGRTYVYHGASSGLDVSPAWTAEGDHAGALFGFRVATAGDVNGDGYSDVIVGAPAYDNGQDNEGAAFAYHGSSSGLGITSVWTAECDQDSAAFGATAATAGDVNGDGYSDVIVGASTYDGVEADEGRVFVYHGSASGLAVSPAWTIGSGQNGAALGISAGTAGDVNGDGYLDVIVGASRYDGTYDDEGRAFVYHGSPSGLATNAAWTVDGGQGGAWLGYSTGTAGDVNGDGYSDVIVGAHWFDHPETNEGHALVYHGSASGLASSPAWTAEGGQNAAHFGIAVGTAGDVNGDAYSDVIVGAAYYDGAHTDGGRASVYHGSSSGLAVSPAWTADGDQASALFGESVGTAGDVNGDGHSDIIVGAYLDGQVEEGRAFVYQGSSSGLGSTSAWTVESDQDGARFGISAGTAGDVNGDGYSDVIVGAYGYDNVDSNEGRASVFYGNEGSARSHALRQANGDDLATIAILGRSNWESGFRVKALGHTPAGRGKVRLQVEAKPFGTAFDGTGLVAGSWTDTGTPSTGASVVALSEVMKGLTPTGLYHWRLRILTDSPFFPRSRWLWLPYNSVTEADVRMPQEGTGVPVANAAPPALHLEPAAPTPFGGSTSIEFGLPKAGLAQVRIFDVTGRLVRDLAHGPREAGRHRLVWDGRDDRGQAVANGVYFVQLKAFGYKQTGRVVRVK